MKPLPKTFTVIKLVKAWAEDGFSNASWWRGLLADALEESDYDDTYFIGLLRNPTRFGFPSVDTQTLKEFCADSPTVEG